MTPNSSQRDSSTASAESDLQSLSQQIASQLTAYLSHLSTSGVSAPSLTFDPQDPDAGIPVGSAGADARTALLSSAHKLIALVSGRSGLYDVSRQYFDNAALQVAVDLDLAQHVPEAEVATAKELAERAGAEEELVVRIMRALTSIYVFEETAPRTYRHTTRSAAMKNEDVKALVSFGSNDGLLTAAQLAEFLKETNYRVPKDNAKTVFQKAYATDKPYFEHIFADEVMGERFKKAMAGTMLVSYDVGKVAEIYPFDKVNGTIVDVGGGQGHVMISIASTYPSADHTYIVQDHPSNPLPSSSPSPKVRFAHHDFFSATQPVQDAAIYFLRHILHDWPDAKCVEILKPVVKAMGKDSRLLICEMVVPERGAPKGAAHRDLLMMAHFGGRERTLADFEGLFKEVDERLDIVKVWRNGEELACILEVVLGA